MKRVSLKDWLDSVWNKYLAKEGRVTRTEFDYWCAVNAEEFKQIIRAGKRPFVTIDKGSGKLKLVSTVRKLQRRKALTKPELRAQLEQAMEIYKAKGKV